MSVGGRASATGSAAAAVLREKQQNEATLLLQKKKQEEEAALLLQKKKQEEEATLLLQKKNQEEDALQIDAVVSVYSGAAPARLSFDLVNEWCDNFSPGKKLGDGTFGEVYQGVFCDSSKRCHQVAVKRLSASNLLLQQPTGGLPIEQIHSELLNNLKREVNTLSAFRHDNIIKLLGYSLPDRSATTSSAAASANNTMCLILELGTRGGLHTHLRDNDYAKILTWKRRLTVLARVSTALNYLHSHHANPCFHRDVKSANIVLTSDYQPKLIDCGLSKFIPDDPAQRLMSVWQSTIGQRFGTPLYMDPVYSNDGNYDAKSEIYSFGIVIAELLTGSLQGVDGIKYSIDTDELIPDLRLVDNPFPVECVQVLQELVMNCLESRRKRISSMAAVMRQLLDLERRYCVRSEAEAHGVDMIPGVQEELQQLRSPIRTRSAEEVTCLSCHDKFTLDNGVKCSNMNHFLCDGCFRSNVTNQLASEYRASFDLHDSNIVCQYCLPTTINAFSQRTLANHVTDELFNQYVEVKLQVIDAKKKEAETVANVCAICLENPKTHCFAPCGHVCVCSGCAGNSSNFNGKCPMCRARFTAIFQPYV